MREIYSFLIILFIFIFAACKNEKTDTVAENVQDRETSLGEVSKEAPLSTQLILDEHTEIIEIIKRYDAERARVSSVYYIRKINMGIPGGDNWLVAWGNIEGDKATQTSSHLYVYILEKRAVRSCYKNAGFSATNPRGTITFDIMDGIPGERIGEGAAAIWDYNKDGYDEVLSFFFGGIGNTFTITGYDPSEDKIVNYFDRSFEIIDKEKGPPPVQFLNYESEDGFIIYKTSGVTTDSPYTFCYYNPKQMRYDTLAYPLVNSR
jgi:hypothetical protein